MSKIATNATFVFIAATVITIFAAGAILTSLISIGAKPVNQEVSDEAGRFSSTFLMTTLFLAILSAAVVILMGSRRAPF